MSLAPTEVIFLHFALSGWDNPMWFQICSLPREISSERERRQTSGRGLRLCVLTPGANAVHLRDDSIISLTVVASEKLLAYAEQAFQLRN